MAVGAEGLLVDVELFPIHCIDKHYAHIFDVHLISFFTLHLQNILPISAVNVLHHTITLTN